MSEKETIDVVRERVGLLYKNATSGIIITFLASSALTFGLDLSHGSPSRVTWWAVMILLLAARGLDGYLWRRRGEYSPNPHQDLFRFRMGVILTALCWCTYFLAFYDSLGIFELTSSMVIMSAMAGGATTVLSGDRLSATIYTQTLLIPNSLLLLADPNTTYKILGLLGVCFGIIMLSISKKTSSFLTHSIQLRFEHKKLLENLERIIESRTQEIIQLNQQDTLTKLLSRSAFLQESKKHINDQNPKEFALFFIDLNDFKPINDNFGHQIGDSVLESIAARLEQIPLKQKLACRWGGDEFIILCQVDPQDSVDFISKKISTTVSSLISIESAELKINASIGVSLFPKHSKSINDLIAFADLAMYNNKNNKDPSNHTIFDFKLYEQASYEYFLGASIKNASTRKQLRIEAQPIFNCKSNQFDTVEVLLRWNLNGKNIPPDTFIPIAEKTEALMK
ncbi:diguanylate cyclase domain-containing protein [Pseudomonas putida]